MNIKKGDKVKVMKGKDRGKTAKVVRVFDEDGKVLLDGLNLSKKSQKPRKQGEKGQVISVAQPIRMDNVMLVCPSCGKAARTGIKVSGDKKSRYCKKCNTNI